MTFTRKRLLKSLWISLFIRPFSHIITWQASSFLEKEDIIRFFPNANVTILPDGIDFDSFNISTLELSKKELIKKYTSRDFEVVGDVIFSMGRLHHIKRFDILIDAFKLFSVFNRVDFDGWRFVENADPNRFAVRRKGDTFGAWTTIDQ